MRATVITLQTTIQPANRSFTHTIVIGDGRARSTDELDQWRLFDLKNNRVTYVDEIARTFRTEPLEDIIARRSQALAKAVPDGAPRAQFSAGAGRRVIAGLEATQATLRAGHYTRELWIGSSPSIPESLFSMMQASEPVSSSFAPMMRAADQALLDLRGFPLADHAELPLDDRKLIVDRSVVRIETRNVPQAMLNVSAAYRNLTPVVADKQGADR